MLNVRFPLNFASPYQATNISEFWRRWHITLSGFLRDYVYIPLGGSRHGKSRRNVNLMATMLLGGLWHGAAWNFVLWGGLHGLFLIIHTGFRRTRLPVPAIVGQMLTLLAVIVAWVPFRASGLDATLAMLRGMAGCNGLALPQMIVHAFPPLAAIATPVPLLRYLGDARTLSFPEVSACLLLGWTIVLALPSVHELSERARTWALTAGFAFTVQALFFAPHVTPFLSSSSDDRTNCSNPRSNPLGPRFRGDDAEQGTFDNWQPADNLSSPRELGPRGQVRMKGHVTCVRLLCACLASLLLYGFAFGFIVDRPLALGFLQQQLDTKLARAASLDGRKLVILAGSNGPYSHRCQAIEPVLAMACVNGGVAVGIGLDYLFARWRMLLRRGDVVYLPMEEAQYIRTRTATGLGPDAAIMFRHDWRTLLSLPQQRWFAALFSFDLRAALMGPIEVGAAGRTFPRPACGGNGRDQRMGRPCRPHRRTGRGEPGDAGNHCPVSCIGRTDPRRLRQYTDCRIHALGERTRRAGDRRTADGIRRCADAGRDAGSNPRSIRCQRRRFPRAAGSQPLSAAGIL